MPTHFRQQGIREQSFKLLLLMTAMALILASVAVLPEASDGSSDSPLRIGQVFESDEMRYEITSLEPYEAKLLGTDSASESLVVPESVFFDGTELNVTSIGSKAFYMCSSLTSADLGDVSTIEPKAFAKCSRLKSVDFGGSLETIGAYSFFKCSKLVDIEIEDSGRTLSEIGRYAFFNCDRISSMAIPSDLDRLGAEAFTIGFADEKGEPLEPSLKGLRGYVYENENGILTRQAGPEMGKRYTDGELRYEVISSFPAELEVSGKEKEFRNITISETIEFDGFEFRITAIGDDAFKNYTKLREVSMPFIEKIGKQSFYGCKYMTPLDLDNVRSIGVKAFAKCTNMKQDVVFGDSLQKISAYAFYACKTLKSIDIPDSVTIIGSYTFFRCYSLQEVELGDSLKSMGNRAFAKTSIQEIEIPASVSRIGIYAFSNCTELRNIDIRGESVTIGNGAFSSCPAIEHISMPLTIKKLGASAFDEQEFRYSDGNVMECTADNLSGKVFENIAGSLDAVKELPGCIRTKALSVDYDSSQNNDLRISADSIDMTRACDYRIYDSDGVILLHGSASASDGSYLIRAGAAGSLPEGSYKLYFDNGIEPCEFEILKVIFDGNACYPGSQTVYLSDYSLPSFELPEDFAWNTSSDGYGRNVYSLEDVVFRDFSAVVYAIEKSMDLMLNEYNSMDKATVFLNMSTCTKKGVREQSKGGSDEEEGDDAGYWKGLAYKCARTYLSCSLFSKQGMIEQLQRDKFTADESVKAVEACDADWREEALIIANSYLDGQSFSKKGLEHQLLYKKFTEEEAAYAVESCDGDWNKEALDKANEYLVDESLSKESLAELLKRDLFTDEETAYAIENCDGDWNKKIPDSPQNII